jgi:DNA polymerase III gamma/tau subunit
MAATEIHYVGFVEALLSLVRQAMVLRHEACLTSDLATSALEELKRWAQTMSDLELSNLFRVWWRCRQELEGSYLDRYFIENVCLEWCVDPGMPTLTPQQPRSQKPQPAQAMPSQSMPPQAMPSQTMPPKTEPPKTELKKKALTLPLSFRDILDDIKAQKPLEGRKLEDIQPLVISSKLIKLAVKPLSLGAQWLENQGKENLLNDLRQLYCFDGELLIEQQIAGSQSILDENNLQKETSYALTIEEAKDHPMTKKILEVFRGEVIDVKVTKAGLALAGPLS